MRCMDQALSFIWPNGRTPYLIYRNKKIIKLRVHGNIPYLVPGDSFCQLVDPDPDYPLLSPCQLYGRGALTSNDSHVAMPGGQGDNEEQAPLDEEAQLQIVPPPKPHKDAVLRKAAKELPHLLIHKPHNPYCEVCN